jgi:uncharacterized protein (TIGR02453 family)
VTLNDLKFLQNLAKHNDREWFQKHRADFDLAQNNFLNLVGGLIFALSEHDDALATIDPKSCLFRIYRDVRFSKNKAPYKTHLAAFICAAGKKSNTMPGFYIHIEPGGKSIFGSGSYMPDKTVLDKFRQDIAAPKSRILKILEDKQIRRVFPDLVDDDKAKLVPRGYAKDHPRAEYLKLKHFFLHTNLSDKEVTSKTLLNQLARKAEHLQGWTNTLRQIAGKR